MMPTQAQVRNFVDARLATLWTDFIRPRQDAFFAARGRFWQGLRTFNIEALPNNPSSGSAVVLEVAPDRNTHPTDQPETWVDSGINLGATIPMALSMDVYESPQGHGYVGTVWVRWNGGTYTRSQNFGPESWRTQPWAQV